MKCFLAIPVKSPAINHQLRLLKQQYPSIRWVPVENLHLTLHFFGEIDPNKIPLILKAIKPICQIQSVFNLKLDSTIHLPSEQKPKVLAYSIQHSEIINKLAKNIHQALANKGFPIEKRTFLPHVTLARINDEPTKISLTLPQITTSISATQVTLFESNSSANGVIYHPIETIKLIEKN